MELVGLLFLGLGLLLFVKIVQALLSLPKIARVEAELARQRSLLHRLQLEIDELAERRKPPVVAEPIPQPVAATPMAAPALRCAPAELLFEVVPDMPAPPPKPAEPTDWTAFEWLAERWMAWVGGAALIVGAGLFLKYAFDQGWVTPPIRAGSAIVLGAALMAVGGWFVRRGYRPAGQGTAGAGLGFWFLGFYAASRWYGLMSETAMIVGLATGAALAIALAAALDAQAIALLGLGGGFLAPLLMETRTPSPVPLFSYVLLLDFSVLAAASVRKWRATELASFAASTLLWWSWLDNIYAAAEFSPTFLLLTATLALFVLLSVWNHLVRNRPAVPADLLLAFAAPVAYLAQAVWLTHDGRRHWHGPIAGGLAAFYLALALVARWWRPGQRLLRQTLVGIGAVFVFAAIPLQWTGQAIPILWAGYAALLVDLGVRNRQAALRGAGIVLFALVQALLAMYVLNSGADPAASRPLFDPRGADANVAWHLLNGRSLSFLASVLALAWAARCYRKLGPGEEREWESGARAAAAFGAAAGIAVWACAETAAFGMVERWPGETSAYLAIAYFAVLAPALAVLANAWGLAGLSGAARVLGLGLFAIVALAALPGHDLDRLVGQPGWRHAALLHPRGLAFGAVLVSLAFLAVLDGRRRSATRAAWTATSQFAFMALFAAWMMTVVEGSALARAGHWNDVETAALWTASLAALAFGALVLTDRVGPDSGAVVHLLALAALGLVFAPLGATAPGMYGHGLPTPRAWWFFPALLNPRGAGLAFGTLATVAMAWYARRPRLQASAGVPLSALNAGAAHLAWWWLLTAETAALATALAWPGGATLAITLAWTIHAFVLFGAGLAWRQRSFRLAALGAFALAAAKICLHDVWALPPAVRYAVFMAFGAALLVASFFHHRFRDRLGGLAASLKQFVDKD